MKQLYEQLGFTEAAQNLREIAKSRDIDDVRKELDQYKRTGRMQVLRPHQPLPMVFDARNI